MLKVDRKLNTNHRNPPSNLTEVSTPSFSKLSAINSSSLSTVLRAASKHYKNGKMDKAEDIYREILATFPGNKRAKKGLTLVLNKSQTKNTQTLISNTIQQLITLYNQGRFHDIIDLEYVNAYSKSMISRMSLG